MNNTRNNIKKCDVFTPNVISNKMNMYLSSRGTLLDPSVGKGALLKNTSKYSKIDVFDLEGSYLSEIEFSNVTKYKEDFLKYDFGCKQYDNIIMNPPYIRIQELGVEYVKFIKERFPTIKKGNIDIYQAFILKSISLLKEDGNGRFVSINPNSILYNKSSKPIMKYLIENRYIFEIIDYNSEKVFENINVYCCIMVFDKSPNKKCIIYNGKEINYDSLYDSIFDTHNECKKLSEYAKPFCGIATLCDKIFIHNSKLFDEPCWKPIFKVSKNLIRFIIFPYDEQGNIIDENIFKTQNPNTYDYLLKNKDLLGKRDKGCKTYERWYAFGRKQGIKSQIGGNVIFVPTMGEKCFPVYKRTFVLFYSGICITPISKTVDEIETILSDEKSRNYVFTNSTKRGSNWINISSTVLSKIPV